jgi:hypothetical protein
LRENSAIVLTNTREKLRKTWSDDKVRRRITKQVPFLTSRFILFVSFFFSRYLFSRDESIFPLLQQDEFTVDKKWGDFSFGGRGNVREEEKMKGSKRGQSFRGWKRSSVKSPATKFLVIPIMVTSFYSSLQGKCVGRGQDHDAHLGGGKPGLATLAYSAGVGRVWLGPLNLA